MESIQRIEIPWIRADGRALTLRTTTYGASVLGFSIPCTEGIRDLLLGPDTVEGLKQQDKYFGATIGRVSNRITGAQMPWPPPSATEEPSPKPEVSSGTQTRQLVMNNGTNCLHGGVPGYQEREWELLSQTENSLVYGLVDPEGSAGFPGALEVQVRYELLAEEEAVLRIVYEAKAMSDTVCALTWHGYWNLNGHGAGSLKGHRLQVYADSFTELRSDSCPTGVCLSVEGTGLDFRSSLDLVQGLARSCPHLKQGRGLDHNYILHTKPTGPIRLAAVLETAELRLRCLTTQPGMQVYTANYLDRDLGKPLPDGRSAYYEPQSGICLEMQAWPDAVHHPQFPSVVLRAGEVYHQETEYRISFIP